MGHRAFCAGESTTQRSLPSLSTTLQFEGNGYYVALYRRNAIFFLLFSYFKVGGVLGANLALTMT